MSAAVYWEDRAGIIQGKVSAERAVRCFAEAAADPHSRLTGDMHEFEYFAFYLPGVGHAIRVRFTCLPEVAAPEADTPDAACPDRATR